MDEIGSFEEEEWRILDPVLDLFRDHLPELRLILERSDYFNVVDILRNCQGPHVHTAVGPWAELAGRVGGIRMYLDVASLKVCHWHRCPLYGRPRIRMSFWCDGCHERMYCSESCQQRQVAFRT